MQVKIKSFFVLGDDLTMMLYQLIYLFECMNLVMLSLYLFLAFLLSQNFGLQTLVLVLLIDYMQVINLDM